MTTVLKKFCEVQIISAQLLKMMKYSLFFPYKMFSGKLFFWTRWIPSWKTCWQESSHVHECFCSKSESTTISFILPKQKFLISNCSSRHARRSCEKPSKNTLQIKQKISAQNPGNVKKTILLELNNFSPNSSFGRSKFCFEKHAKSLCYKSEKIWSAAENVLRTIFNPENFSKGFPGYVKSSIDNHLEEFLQSPKNFRWNFEGDAIYYFYFNKIALMKRFLWKQQTHFWKKLSEKAVAIS